MYTFSGLNNNRQRHPKNSKFIPPKIVWILLQENIVITQYVELVCNFLIDTIFLIMSPFIERYTRLV